MFGLKILDNISIEKFIGVLVIILSIIIGAGCSNSTDPEAVQLEPEDRDPPPYFLIYYGREETSGSNGVIESIDLTLLHLVKGDLIDYGLVTFGGVILPVEKGPGGSNGSKFYHKHLQTDLPGQEFRPEFRFDTGKLKLKAVHSPHIEQIDVELQIPTVRYLTNPSSGDVVNPEEDLNIEVNQSVFGVDMFLQPTDPKANAVNHGILEFTIPDVGQTLTISASHLQLVKSMSEGNRYLLHFSFHNALAEVDFIEVKAKHSDNKISLPVFFSSDHRIEFIMEN